MRRKASPMRAVATGFVLLVILGGISFSYFARAQSFGPPQVRHSQGIQGGLATHGSLLAGELTDQSNSRSQTTTEDSNSSGTTESQNETSTTTSSGSESGGENSTSVTTSQSESENDTATQTTTSTQDSGNETETSTSTTNSTETESENQTSTETTSDNGTTFVMIPANFSSLSLPQGYLVGNGTVEVKGGDGQLEIHLELGGMNPSTTYALSVTINGTSHTVGNFTSSSEGDAEFELSVPLAAGTYSIGLSVLDVSTLATTFTVLVGSPASANVTVSQGEDGGSTTTESVTAHSLGENDTKSINNAISGNQIPLIVSVSSSGLNYSVIDHTFTVFVGQLQSNGLQISISGTNVTSSKVILVNLNSAQFSNLASGAFIVSFDGTRIQQASSLAQVLNTKPTDKPSFILIASGGAYQLLVAIPHFSTHLIQILPAVVSQIGGILAVNLPILALSIGVVTLAFAAVYARRVEFLR